VEPAGTAPEGAETPAPSQGAQAETAAATKLDLAAIAYQRAVSRGKHYMESRAGCAECHGDDFGGKVLVQSTLAGTLTAPNITRGGVVKSYKAEDWVRVIRHGLKPNGTPAAMPSELYASFSDQEISDMVAYLRSVPAVDRTLAASKLGPLMWFRIVRGDTPISAELIDHAVQRPKSPPPTSKATEELGKHLAAVCSACHGADLAGGPVPGGDSDWPPAKNLTPHANGLEKWSLDDFEKALREGTRPDGGRIDPPMPVKYTKNFKDTEVESLYVYLKTLPAKEAGAH
jgi:cytochrome c553